MRYINVVGTSAAGKSTLSKAIAGTLGLGYIELDNLFWQDNWQQSCDEAFFEAIEQAQAQYPKGYVIDGNYTRSIPVKWRQIDTVIWLDLPFSQNLRRAIRRAVSRAWYQQPLWSNSNNRESFKQLFSRDSIVWWMIKTHRKNQRHYQKLMRLNPNLNWIHLQSTQQVEQFLTSLKDQNNRQTHKSPR